MRFWRRLGKAAVGVLVDVLESEQRRRRLARLSPEVREILALPPPRELPPEVQARVKAIVDAKRAELIEQARLLGQAAPPLLTSRGTEEPKLEGAER